MTADAGTDGSPRLWVAAERLPELAAAYPRAALAPEIAAPPRLAARPWPPEEAVRELVRARLEVLGPVTAAALAAESGLDRGAVDAALAALEGEGAVLQGRFTPGTADADAGQGDLEWCERRLLARIHRYTLNRLRREIEPVSRADLARFLLVWQRVAPDERAEGPQALAAVLEQLAGFSAPAAAWEGEVLPARVADYDPAWLDALCLSGRFVWCRATPPPGGRSAPLRTTPITFLPRAELACWRQVVGAPEPVPESPEPVTDALQLSAEARQVAEVLARRGATFFSDLAAAAGLLHTQAERALAELVACGLVTSDSFTGLRALLVPEDRRPAAGGGFNGGGIHGGGGKRRGRTAPFGMEGAGRWSLLSEVLGGGADSDTAPPAADRLERLAGSGGDGGAHPPRPLRRGVPGAAGARGPAAAVARAAVAAAPPGGARRGARRTLRDRLRRRAVRAARSGGAAALAAPPARRRRGGRPQAANG